MRRLATGLAAVAAVAAPAHAHHAGETETLWEAIADHVADNWAAALLLGLVMVALAVVARWRKAARAAVPARRDDV